jgi:hypothetical protein
MTGIEELLLSIALDFTSDKINKLIKSRETLETDLLRSYNDALKEWSKNDDIRNMTARNFSSHFMQLGEYLKSPSSQIKEIEIEKLINLWGLKLRNYDKTYYYILEKQNEKLIEDMGVVRAFVDKNNKHSEIKLQQFEPIPDYIPRQVSTQINNFDFLTPNPTYKLREIIADNETHHERKFILYSSAQTGKTTELKHLAYQLQESELYTPFLFELNNYDSFDFYKRLKNIVVQFDGVLLLLDAYDEIKDSNKDNFISQLNLFTLDFPNIPMSRPTIPLHKKRTYEKRR